MGIIKEKQLVKRAIEAMSKAYVPYSNFCVGACAEASDGTYYTGCNIENSSYGLTICAERVALFKAFSEGRREIVALAVAADVDEPVSPCGACRQVIAELASNSVVILSNRDGTRVEKLAPEDLLPNWFKLGN
ncbi:MAG: cytidine deaminase [Tepidanaerobacteraceae bacterium]|jgi:cytidine deaminase